MTSKEALRTIANTKTNHIKSEKIGQPRVMYLVKEERKKELECIKQDLERLDVLEKLVTDDCIAGNQIGLDIVNSLITKNKQLEKENEKLKKVIEENQEKIEASDKLLVKFGNLLMAIRIMNYREVNVAIFKLCDTTKEYNEFGSIELQEEDFKFLKEVLKEYGKF